MKHGGKAMQSAVKLLTWAVVILGVLAVGLRAGRGSGRTGPWGAVLSPLVVFAAFTLYFSGTRRRRVPTGAGVVVAPAHVKVDIIDTRSSSEEVSMEADAAGFSIFLSVFNVHVQQAPVSGRVMLGGSANSREVPQCAQGGVRYENENVLIGFDATEPGKGRVGMRLLAGLIARRIIPWLKVGEDVQKRRNG